MLNFGFFLSLKEPLMATFSEKCSLTSRKYGFEPRVSIRNLSRKLQIFMVTEKAEKVMDILKFSEEHKSLWSHSSVFALQ